MQTKVVSSEWCGRTAGDKDVQILLANLKACSNTQNVERGRHFHAEAVECRSISVTNALINMYAKCGSMGEAYDVFSSLEQRTVVSWNTLILGYSDNGEGYTALNLFTKMKSEGPVPNYVTFVAAFKACTSLAEWADKSKALHALASENGCNSHIYVQNTMVDVYAKCGSMMHAHQVFDSLKVPTVVSWTILINGYAENGQAHIALDLFTRMKICASNSVTIVAALKACILLADSGRVRGKVIHNLVAQNGWNSDIYVQSTLVDMYSKCGCLVGAQQVFDIQKRPSVVSWTALISGYADNGQGHTALILFSRMRTEGPTPNSITLIAALKACGLMGALEFGRTIHSEINSFDLVLVTCLVDFYAKCGSLVEARSIFDSHEETRDMITWTALLAGFSNYGDHEVAFELFEGLQVAGFRPDGITFLCILTCCSRAGLVVKGKECFDAMPAKYGVKHSVEHYTCMIDIFGRANKLDAAMNLLKRMNCSPNDVTWMTILGACRKWSNVEIGKLAFESLINFNDKDAAVYVLMGQIYGSVGMRHEQEKVMGLKRKLKALNKPEETCWTNEMGEVHAFFVDDNRHPQIQEIICKLEKLECVYVRQQHSYVNFRSVTAQNEESLCGHSELLAVACALINTQCGKTVRIVKNLTGCADCHTTIALISKLEYRTVICRDASGMHIFKDGRCSCDFHGGTMQ